MSKSKSSPSSYARTSACEASTVLPHSARISERAVRGTILHAFLAKVAEVGRDEALTTVPEEYREAAECIDFERLPKMSIGASIQELALAMDFDSGVVRELGRGGTLDHFAAKAMAQEGEATCVLDHVEVLEDAVLYLDWKFGYARQIAAADNKQLAMGASMAARRFKKSKAYVGIVRIPDHGTPYFDVAQLDEMDLEIINGEIAEHMRRLDEVALDFAVTKVIPAPVEGSHCTYCPAYNFCPAKVALALSTFENGARPPALFAQLPEPLTPEIAGQLWNKMRAAEGLLETMKTKLKEFARTTPFEIGDGLVVGLVEKETSSIDPDKATPVLLDKYDAAFVTEVMTVKRSVTKKAIDAAVKARVPKGKGAKHINELYDVLEKAGAMRESKSIGIEEIKRERLLEVGGES